MWAKIGKKDQNSGYDEVEVFQEKCDKKGIIEKLEFLWHKEDEGSYQIV